jgi:hypothetical protein
MEFEEFKADYLMKQDLVNAHLVPPVSITDDDAAIPASPVKRGRKLLASLVSGGGSKAPLPKLVNWVKEGKVAAVKDQAGCANSWAISAAAAVEAAYFISKNTTSRKLAGFVLSDQQLIDCATANFNGYGCKGGSASSALEYIATHNLTLAANYINLHKDGA